MENPYTIQSLTYAIFGRGSRNKKKKRYIFYTCFKKRTSPSWQRRNMRIFPSNARDNHFYFTSDTILYEYGLNIKREKILLLRALKIENYSEHWTNYLSLTTYHARYEFPTTAPDDCDTFSGYIPSHVNNRFRKRFRKRFSSINWTTSVLKFKFKEKKLFFPNF